MGTRLLTTSWASVLCTTQPPNRQPILRKWEVSRSISWKNTYLFTFLGVTYTCQFPGVNPSSNWPMPKKGWTGCQSSNTPALCLSLPVHQDIASTPAGLETAFKAKGHQLTLFPHFLLFLPPFICYTYVESNSRDRKDRQPALQSFIHLATQYWLSPTMCQAPWVYKGALKGGNQTVVQIITVPDKYTWVP